LGLIKIVAGLVISYVLTIGLEVSTELSTPGAWLAHGLIAHGWFKGPWPIGYTLQITFWTDTLLCFAILCVAYAFWSHSQRNNSGQEQWQ
jgi:hypothetical protein